jgi:2-polyprenyl-6-hydroxyphenyl methylase / 3-demethylubiquinone-9 3-methyltransferase
MPAQPSSTVDAADLARFERLGAQWWDLSGPMQALHKINPVRLGYLREQIAGHFTLPSSDPAAALAGLRILDIGCGGGILSEPLARLGASVTGIDPAPGNIAIAQSHAGKAGLVIDYRAVTAESLAASGEQFDVVLAMEVVEHVTNMPAFVKTAGALVRPGGLLGLSTINRTLKSFALAIVGAEYVLGWVAKGTHQWEKFVTPDELQEAVEAAGLRVRDETGMTYNPLRGVWALASDTGVNYFMTAVRS